MALGFFAHHARERALAWSGGSEPGTAVNPAAVAAMAERGIDISGEYPKPWTDEVVRAADVIITMGCGDACPIFPDKRYADWDLPDPEGLDVIDVRPIRDEIDHRVLRLLDDLGRPVAPSRQAPDRQSLIGSHLEPGGPGLRAVGASSLATRRAPAAGVGDRGGGALRQRPTSMVWDDVGVTISRPPQAK